jgi:hypothetical protein
MRPGAPSVAVVARTHGVNANQVFNWRKLYHAGRWGSGNCVRTDFTKRIARCETWSSVARSGSMVAKRALPFRQVTVVNAFAGADCYRRLADIFGVEQDTVRTYNAGFREFSVTL